MVKEQLFSVFFGWDLRHESRAVALIIRCHPFEAADGNRGLLDPGTPAGRFTGPVADAAKDTGEDVGYPVERKGLVIFPLADPTNILGYRGV